MPKVRSFRRSALYAYSRCSSNVGLGRYCPASSLKTAIDDSIQKPEPEFQQTAFGCKIQNKLGYRGPKTEGSFRFPRFPWSPDIEECGPWASKLAIAPIHISTAPDSMIPTPIFCGHAILPYLPGSPTLRHRVFRLSRNGMPTAPYGFIRPTRRAYQMQTANYWFTR